MVKRDSFGTLPDGREVFVFTLRNERGMEVRLTNYGATIVSILAPDREGRLADVVLGYDSLRQYLDGKHYFGCTVGRYANRIAGGRFMLDGNEVRLATNDGPNHLHGGVKGFDKVLWEAEERILPEGPAVLLHYVSTDGEEGYPGTLDVHVTITLTADNTLRIVSEATSDKTTVVNLTNHSYFNLAGAGEGDVSGQILTIAANRFTPVDSTQIPLGRYRDVAGTPFDFRTPRAIGDRIDEDDVQLRIGSGYDHHYVLNRNVGGLILAARAEDPRSGRVLEVRTTEPGLQLYTGNHLDGTIGKGGKRYARRGGFCLETQHAPDTPNHPSFQSATLHPGGKYHSETEFVFSTTPR
ncbi:MAG: galactose mutarotase [Ignavibacteria bacterium]|nr:galactose mutarotase [Ignavibacteria bacterium]